MKIIFSKKSWEDFSYWLDHDKKMVKRIRLLLQDIERNNYDGIGKPEPLKYDLAGWWSRRIDKVHRLLYRIEKNNIEILACRFHYSK